MNPQGVSRCAHLPLSCIGKKDPILIDGETGILAHARAHAFGRYSWYRMSTFIIYPRIGAIRLKMGYD